VRTASNTMPPLTNPKQRLKLAHRVILHRRMTSVANGA
jgi:hypothetical protein